MGKRIILFLFLMSVLWAGILYDSSGKLHEKSHSVEVTVKNRIVFTKVTHVFANTSSEVLKVKYLFDTPPGAVIYSLAIWRDGKEVQGISTERFCEERVDRKVVNVDHAVVAGAGYHEDAYHLYMYPVQPNKIRRVEILYWCMLPDRGKVNYIYPMRQRRRPDKATHFSFKMHLDNNTSFVYSDNRLDVRNKLITFYDPHFYYQKDIDIHLRLQNLNIPPLFYRQQEQKEGYFTAFIDAPVTIDRRKAITFLLDISGSMTDKWEYTKQTLCKHIDMLNKRHYFQIVTFGSQAKKFAPKFIIASSQNKQQVKSYLDGLQLHGETDLRKALQEAESCSMPFENMAYTIVVMSDGQVPQGEKQQILASMDKYPGIKYCFLAVSGKVFPSDMEFMQKLTKKKNAFYAELPHWSDNKESEFVHHLLAQHNTFNVMGARVIQSGFVLIEDQQIVVTGLYKGTSAFLEVDYWIGKTYTRKKTVYKAQKSSSLMPFHLWSLDYLDHIKSEREIFTISKVVKTVSMFTALMILDEEHKDKKWSLMPGFTIVCGDFEDDLGNLPREHYTSSKYIVSETEAIRSRSLEWKMGKILKIRKLYELSVFAELSDYASVVRFDEQFENYHHDILSLLWHPQGKKHRSQCKKLLSELQMWAKDICKKKFSKYWKKQKATRTQALYLLQKLYACGQTRQSRKTLIAVQKICQQILEVAEHKIPDFCKGKELGVFVEEVRRIHDATVRQIVAFDHSLQLQGVISCKAKSFVVINHCKLEIGDPIARFVVADIEDNKVLLIDGDVFICLYTSPHIVDRVQQKQNVEKTRQYARSFADEMGKIFKIYTPEFLIPHRNEKLFMVEHLLEVGIHADSIEVVQEATERCEILHMMTELLGAFGNKFTIYHKIQELCTTTKKTLQNMRK